MTGKTVKDIINFCATRFGNKNHFFLATLLLNQQLKIYGRLNEYSNF